jgi:flagellar biosynthesis/type III secretory pathway chaperone
MNNDWNEIAGCLRDEISEYGALLNAFEAQQHALFGRDSEGVLRISGEIESQVRVIRDTRDRRERVVAAFAIAHGRPQAATLRSLINLLEPDAQPLVEALIKEVNVLIHRVRRANRHNHMMLARTVTAHRDAIRMLRPGSYDSTYTAAGRTAGISPAVALSAEG